MSKDGKSNATQDKELDALRKEVDELKDFKRRIELGTWWLTCAFYAIGSIAVFAATILSMVKDWVHIGK